MPPPGALVLRATGHRQFQAAIVVLAVGLHFLPFAPASSAPADTLLGWLLAAIGALGLVLGWIIHPVAAAARALQPRTRRASTTLLAAPPPFRGH